MTREAQWVTVPIKQLYLGLFDGPHATPKPSESGPVFLGIRNVTDDGQLDLSDVRHIAEEDYAAWTRRIEPRPGDLVFTYEATLNRYAIIPEGFRGCLGRRMALIRPDPRKVNARFLLYAFFAKEWRDIIAQNTLVGSTVDRIPLTKFPEFPIRVPPLAAQHRIAEILAAYDALLDNNLQRIRILEEMARTLYRDWFVQFQYPGCSSDRIVRTAIGSVPEGWTVAPVTDCVLVNPRVSVPRDGEKPFVPMTSLANDSMLIRSVESRAGNSGSKFQNGDTLFARITPCLENGKTGFVQFLPDRSSVAFGSTEFIVLRSKTLSPEFVYLLARSPEFREHAIKSMTGASGRQRVQEACFGQFLIPVPPDGLVRDFSKLVSPMFRCIHQLHMAASNLRQTRDLLLPRLLSGRVKFPMVETAA